VEAREAIYEQSPVRYSRRSADDVMTQWMRTLPQNQPVLDRSSPRAYLESVLRELDIPVESQLLVFSQTSFQNSQISGRTPRALYFNENHYVGYVQGGELELITTDPRLGMTFYTISVPEPEDPRAPVINRNPACLTCHASNRQTEFPGLMTFSVFATESGSQILRGRTHIVDDTTPVEKRWGGWYVTGKVEAAERHRGNVWYSAQERLDGIGTEDRVLADTLVRMEDLLPMHAYPAPGSDVVALMVFEHQVRVHNQIVNTFGQSRVALYADEEYMAHGVLQPHTVALFDEAAEKLLRVMLFEGEADLRGVKIEGDAAFQEAFQRNAIRDEQGRSLKDLNLRDRLFEYRLSYMIASDGFNYLPSQFKERFFKHLDAVLDGSPETDGYDWLPVEERRAIREILAAMGIGGIRMAHGS